MAAFIPIHVKVRAKGRRHAGVPRKFWKNNMRKVWRIPKAGKLKALSLESEALVPLASDKLRVRTKAIGLNFADIFALTGLYSATPKGSFIPGLEFSGIIEALGAEVSGFEVGMRVMGAIRFGAYAEVVDADPAACRPLPHDWSFQQGAAFPVQSLTAWYALKHLGNVKRDQQVLVQSAAGGVGLQAMKMCAALGARPIGTVGKRDKIQFLADQGFRRVLLRDEYFVNNLNALLDGQPLSLVLDAIGGSIQKQCFKALAPTGRLVVFGAARFTPGSNRPNYLKAALQWLTRPRYDVLSMISQNKSVMAFNLIWLWQDIGLFNGLAEEIEALNLSPPHVGGVFPFEQAHQAIQALRSGCTVGKIVLDFDS